MAIKHSVWFALAKLSGFVSKSLSIWQSRTTLHPQNLMYILSVQNNCESKVDIVSFGFVLHILSEGHWLYQYPEGARTET